VKYRRAEFIDKFRVALTLIGSRCILQVDILRSHLKSVYKLLFPASKRMNWLSLTVNEYVARCNFAIGKFTSLVHQLQKNIDDANKRLQDMESADLFRLPEYDHSELPDVTIFMHRITKLRAVDIKTVVRNYNDIGPILTKVSALGLSTPCSR